MEKEKNKIIFDYVVVIECDSQFSKTPEITYRFPPQTSSDSLSSTIVRFCFPEADSSVAISSVRKNTGDEGKDPKESKKSSVMDSIAGSIESFSFILTEASGNRRFGYCRRLLVPNSKNKKELNFECFCILSF